MVDMSQIMESQMSQTVLRDNIVETACHIFGRDQLTVVITADKALKFLIIGTAANFLEVSFKLFLFEEHSLDVRYQRKRSSCGIGFESCLYEQLTFAVLIIVVDNLTLNGACLVGEVDSVPPQTEYFASSQTIVGGKVYHQSVSYYSAYPQSSTFSFVCSPSCGSTIS